jgi:hypothetical protein
MAMSEGFFRAVETLFTAYAIPALLVPFVWLGRPLLGGRRSPALDAAGSLLRLQQLYAVLGATWFGAWLALRAGIPLESPGRLAVILSWSAYVSLNVVFACVLVRFTARYGDVPEGRAKDRLFLGLLSVVVAQPLATACAFAVLYRIMGVLYQMKVPGLIAVQEGI